MDKDTDELVETLGVEVVSFDGFEEACLGLAERFTDGGHVWFLVYDYERMVEIIGGDPDEAREYLEFNVVDLYAGPGTPAILRR